MDGQNWDASSIADAVVAQTNLGTVHLKFKFVKQISKYIKVSCSKI